MDHETVTQMLHQYHALLVCRDMCRFLCATVSKLRDAQGGSTPGSLASGPTGRGDWSIFSGQGLTGVMAVLESLASMFSNEMDRLYACFSSHYPRLSTANARSPNDEPSQK